MIIFTTVITDTPMMTIDIIMIITNMIITSTLMIDLCYGRPPNWPAS